MDINLGKYAKFIVALLGALGVLGVALAANDTEAVGHFTSEELVTVLTAFAAAAAVFAVPNKKK